MHAKSVALDDRATGDLEGRRAKGFAWIVWSTPSRVRAPGAAAPWPLAASRRICRGRASHRAAKLCTEASRARSSSSPRTVLVPEASFSASAIATASSRAGAVTTTEAPHLANVEASENATLSALPIEVTRAILPDRSCPSTYRATTSADKTARVAARLWLRQLHGSNACSNKALT
jgi:hypothetical protein